MVQKLKKEIEYFNSNSKALVEKYKWRFIVIKGEKVMGDYDTALAAVKEAMKAHKPGTFLVQSCEPIWIKDCFIVIPVYLPDHREQGRP